MTIDPLSEFYRVLQKVVGEHLGSEHSCTKAIITACAEIEAAVPTDDLHQAQALVQSELSKLDKKIHDQIMRQTHVVLATDTSAILAQWNAGPNQPKQ